MKKVIVISFILIAVGLLLQFVAHAQNAKIYFLEKAETDQAKVLYDNLQLAQSAWDKFNKELGKKYTSNETGWEPGFQYDKDFKVIVPKSPPLSISSNDGNITVIPAPWNYNGSPNTFSCCSIGDAPPSIVR